MIEMTGYDASDGRRELELHCKVLRHKCCISTEVDIESCPEHHADEQWVLE
jgi:hypothetical protein